MRGESGICTSNLYRMAHHFSTAGNAYTRSKWAGYAVGTVLQAVLTDGIATEASVSAKVVAAEARADEILNAARAVEEVANVDRVAGSVISKPAELEGVRFGEKSTAWNWADQHYEEWGHNLTPDEHEAVYLYTRDNYKNINNVLRGLETEYSGKNAEYVELITQALEKKPVPEDVIVHRGTSLASFGPLKNIPYEEWIGQTVPERGFLSTSLINSGAFQGEVVLELKVPKGTPAAFVGNISDFKNEVELLLNKDQEIMIHRVETINFGRIKVIGEIVNKGGH